MEVKIGGVGDLLDAVVGREEVNASKRVTQTAQMAKGKA
jgi:hypothetical protein